MGVNFENGFQFWVFLHLIQKMLKSHFIEIFNLDNYSLEILNVVHNFS
jgi:hypothetical protein